MEPARRFRLLWQSKAAQFAAGEIIISADAPPDQVFIIYEGQVNKFAHWPGETGPITLEDAGPGECVGWLAAMSGMPGMAAVAATEVNGVIVPAAAFLEICRYDAAMRAAIFRKAWCGEIWRAVRAEMNRRGATTTSARPIVELLEKLAVAKDWPEDEAEISAAKDHVWVVVGGEGAAYGDRWAGGDCVLWARLIGLPERELSEALASARATPQKESLASMTHSRGDALANVAISPATIKSTPSALPETIAPSEPDRPPYFPEPNQIPAPRPKRVFARGLAFAAAVLAISATGVAWWASGQPVTTALSFPGELAFAGQTKPLLVSTSGTLADFPVHEGERVEPGELLAVVRPPFDEGRWTKLNEIAEQAMRDAKFCEQCLKGGEVTEAGVQPAIVELARERQRISSELRVLAAIAKGEASVPDITPDEIQRVREHFAEIAESQAQRADGAARDVAARYEDLRDAEQALRDAQEEASSHRQSFSGAVSDNKKEAAREMADFRRMQDLLKRQIASRQENVNRLKREIALIKAEAKPAAGSAGPSDDRTEQPAAQNELARIEAEVRLRGQSARELAQQTTVALDQLKAESAPRQIVSRASGRLREISPLSIGAQVNEQTALAQFVVKESWRIACELPAEQKDQIRNGKYIRISYRTKDGKVAETIEPLQFARCATPQLRLGTTNEEWREGMKVQVDTEVVTGSLLEKWIGQLRELL